MQDIFSLIGYSLIPILFIIGANKKAKNGKSPKVLLIILGVLTALAVLGTIAQGDFSGTVIPEIAILIVCFIIAVATSVSNYKKFKKNEEATGTKSDGEIV